MIFRLWYDRNMEKRYYKHKLENLFVIERMVTLHYFEFDKDFCGQSESHDFWELVYADKASVICTADGREILLAQGEVLFHKPGETHSLRADGKNAPNVFIISFVCKSQAVRFFENKKLVLPTAFLRFIYAIIEEGQQTFDMPYSDPNVKKMALLSSPALGGQQMIKNFLEILLVNLMRQETEKENAEAVFLPLEETQTPVAERVIAFLKEHVGERLEISDVCDALHYNKSYIFQQFKKATNYSVMAYFTKLKIDAAKRYLRETDLSIAQIADKLAFDTPNYFSKTFKKVTGYTPLRYKKMRKTS